MTSDSLPARPLPSLRRLFTGTTGCVYVLLCVMLFIEYIDRVNISVAAPLIRTELHLTNTQLGFALSAFGYCYATFQIINGYIGDRYGPRLTLTVCGLLWAAGTIATGFVGGLTSLVFARMLVGLGEAGTIPTGARVMSNWVPANRRGFAQGFTHSSARLAAGVTPPIVVALIAFVGWRGAFMALGVVSLLWAIVWVTYFRNNPRDHKRITPDELADLPDFHPPQRDLRTVPFGPLVVRILPVALVFFCHAWTLWLFLTWLPSFFAESYGLDLKHSALFTSGVFLAGMVGDTAGGVLSDAIYKRTGDLNKARRNAVIIGFAGSLIFLLPVLFVRDAMMITLALGASLFFLEMTEGPIWAVPIDVAPGFAGVAGGIMSTAAGLAAVASPTTFGILVDWTGSYSIPFVVSMALAAIGIVLSFFMRPDRQVLGAPQPTSSA
jgi:MFS family permease